MGRGDYENPETLHCLCGGGDRSHFGNRRVDLAHVGSAAPELSLAAADGSSRSLAAIEGPKVLIFYRGLW